MGLPVSKIKSLSELELEPLFEEPVSFAILSRVDEIGQSAISRTQSPKSIPKISLETKKKTLWMLFKESRKSLKEFIQDFNRLPERERKSILKNSGEPLPLCADGETLSSYAFNRNILYVTYQKKLGIYDTQKGAPQLSKTAGEFAADAGATFTTPRHGHPVYFDTILQELVKSMKEESKG